MARKDISTPLDLKNLENHNTNYKELYSLIGETDTRLSENMWDEIKGANTMKMLEPVATKAELPASAKDKSLISVLDEQRVYAYVHDEWAPFTEIDLDPFSPFKDELKSIITEYEQKIKDITADVTKTKDSAISSIQSTQSQSESNVKQSEQSAVKSIDEAQAEAEEHMADVEQQLKDKTAEFTTKFNSYLDQLANSKTASLDEIEKAKQEALASVTNENMDNWQKYKLTNDDGGYTTTSMNSDLEALHSLAGGLYYLTSVPIEGASSTAGYVQVEARTGISNIKRITFKPYNSGQEWVKWLHNDWSDWEPMGGTKVELYDGSAKANGDKVNLKIPYDRFTELKIKLNRTGGIDILSFDAEGSSDISINTTNVYNDASEGKLYELILSKTTKTQLTVASQVSRTFGGSSSEDAGIEILKVWGVK